MQTWWLTFTDGSHGACDGESDFDAKQIAEKLTGKIVAGDSIKVAAKRLPYPAKPVIWTFNHPVHGECPPLCHSPSKCAGRTSCPQPYSCSE